MRPSLSLRSALRRFTLGSGPLKRRSDRVEFASRLFLVLALLCAAPVAVAAGTAVADGLSRTAHQQTVTRVEERATLVADAKGDPTSGTIDVPVQATWLGPDGNAHAGNVTAPIGLRAGSSVSVWLDRSSGTVVEAPMSDAVVTDQSLVVGAVTFLGMVIVGLSAHLAVVAILARRRARRWESGWEQVEPLWISRFW